MAKATGTTEHWNVSRRGYLCLFNGHPPSKEAEIDCSVTPEMEASTLLDIADNFKHWKAQFQVTNKFPAYKQKVIHKLLSAQII